MKALLRKKNLEMRAALTEAEIERFSRSVFHNIVEAGLLRNKNSIMTYLDFRKEVRTGDILSYALANNLTLSIPVCIPETRELIAARVTSLNELAAGHYGIREPEPEKIRITDCNTLDIIFTPGAAFDYHGNRIGYGAGYYDKFFNRLGKDVLKVALAYSFQVVDHVPSEEYDIPVDYIVTEKEVILTKKAGR